jgi:hypothetical protein
LMQNVCGTHVLGGSKSLCGRFSRRENLSKRCTESVRFESLRPRKRESPSGGFLL